MQVCIVIGGGNFWRGRTSENMDRVKADQIGMLATVMNCIYTADMFRSVGIKSHIMTPFACGSMTELFNKDKAVEYMEAGEVCFFAGGTGHPYFSTDTSTVLMAVQVSVDAILMAKAIDGVYDSDPKVNPDARKYDELPISEIIDKKLGVIDLSAAVLAMENRMPMLLFGLNQENSIVKSVSGDFTGTRVTCD
jgi:uridylate kinase